MKQNTSIRLLWIKHESTWVNECKCGKSFFSPDALFQILAKCGFFIAKMKWQEHVLMRAGQNMDMFITSTDFDGWGEDISINIYDQPSMLITLLTFLNDHGR